MKRKMYIRMVTASLLRRRSRMVVALLSIAIGATILSGLVTIYYDVPRQMGAQFRNYGANMIFTATGDSFAPGDMDRGRALIGEDNIVGAAPFRYETVRIHETPVLAAGTDMAGVQKTSPYWSVEGDWCSGEKQLMVGANVAEKYRLKVGDTVEVRYTVSMGGSEESSEESSSAETGVVENTAENSYDDNAEDFTVMGILSTGGSEEDYVYMSLTDMEGLTGVSGAIDVAELSISGSQDELKAYAADISAQVPGISAKIVKRVTASEATVLTKLQALVLLVTIVVLALTMICVATTMTAVVAERRKEIGLRKAIGASDASIVAEFMGESMLLGFLGGILGSALGFVFAQQVSVHVFSSTISFRWLLLPITVIVSIAVTGISSLMPIKSATEVDPALVLKGE